MTTTKIESEGEDYIFYPNKLNEILNYNDYGDGDSLKQIHPSSMGYCKRQMLSNKLGIKELSLDIKAKMAKGTAFHEFLQSKKFYRDDKVEMSMFEAVNKQFLDEDEGVFVKGRCDAIDTEGNIYDYKITGGLSYLNGSPRPKDVDQLQVYLELFDKEKGYLVYVSRSLNYVKGSVSKSQPIEVVQFEVERDRERFNTLRDKALDVYRELSSMVESVKGVDIDLNDFGEEDISFEKCGCFFCRSEGELDFEKSDYLREVIK